MSGWGVNWRARVGLVEDVVAGWQGLRGSALLPKGDFDMTESGFRNSCSAGKSKHGVKANIIL